MLVILNQLQYLILNWSNIMSKKNKVNNYVAKYCNEFNKAQTHVDRKKEFKKGKIKHKGGSEYFR